MISIDINNIISEIVEIRATDEFNDAQYIYAMAGKGTTSQASILQKIDELVDKGCEISDITPADIYKMVSIKESQIKRNLPEIDTDEYCEFPF